MQIKVTRVEDGPACVEVINPDGDKVVSSAVVKVAQEVVVTTSDSPENPPFIGEVQDCGSSSDPDAEPEDRQDT